VLTTWASWVNENVDPARTSVFFMSMSPLHIRHVPGLDFFFVSYSSRSLVEPRAILYLL
jgi:hypothetical protein